MAVLVLSPAASDKSAWRSALEELGPRLASAETRSDVVGSYVAGNMTLLRDQNFLALAVPAELGGAGLSRVELAAMLRTLARHCSSTALAFAMHTHVVAAAAWRWKHQQAPVDGLLKRVASERIQLLSSGGSDWLMSSGKAVKVEGGYRIQARKNFASGAPSAQLFMTSAVEEDAADGPTVLHFALPMTAEGVSVLDNWDTLGMRGTGSQDVLLDNVFVPDIAISGRRKPGPWHPLLHIVSMVAIPLVYAVYAGIAEAARDIAIEAARKRPAEADLDLAGALDTERAALGITIDSMVEFAETAQPSPETTNRIFMHRALVARNALKTVDSAMELAGGVAYFRKFGLEKLFRDVQGARFHPLRDATQRRLAGRMALGLPIDG
jgi:acyl-CoA dehydrogenase